MSLHAHITGPGGNLGAFALGLWSLPVLWGSLDRLVGVWSGIGSDPRYLTHPWLTAWHLLPGLVFFLAAPWQVARWPGHRIVGRLAAVAAMVSGAGVLAMVFAFPALGGALTQGATTLIITAMTAALVWAIVQARRRHFAAHRRWMIRALALAYAVATARWLILGLGLFGLPFARVFVPASGLGVVLNLVLAEWLLGASGILATFSMHTPVSRQKPLPRDEG